MGDKVLRGQSWRTGGIAAVLSGVIALWPVTQEYAYGGEKVSRPVSSHHKYRSERAGSGSPNKAWTRGGTRARSRDFLGSIRKYLFWMERKILVFLKRWPRATMAYFRVMHPEQFKVFKSALGWYGVEKLETWQNKGFEFIRTESALGKIAQRGEGAQGIIATTKRGENESDVYYRVTYEQNKNEFIPVRVTENGDRWTNGARPTTIEYKWDEQQLKHLIFAIHGKTVVGFKIVPPMRSDQ